ncbi:MAG TPA: hypothetical protein VF796_26490, partial [Humisphaera sp.]
VVWDPQGGLRLAAPPDVRDLCLAAAAARGFPRVRLPHRPAEAVMAGEAAWRAFAGTALFSDLLHALQALDDLD